MNVWIKPLASIKWFMVLSSLLLANISEGFCADTIELLEKQPSKSASLREKAVKDKPLKTISIKLPSQDSDGDDERMSPRPPQGGFPPKESASNRAKTPRIHEESDKAPLLSGSAQEIKLNHFITNVPYEDDNKTNPYTVKHIGIISQTLKIVDIAILQEKEKQKASTESAELFTQALDEEGDIRNGLFVIFESLRRPHRYHGCLYDFVKNQGKNSDKAKKQGTEVTEGDEEDSSPYSVYQGEDSPGGDIYHEVTLRENARMSGLLRKLFRTDRQLGVNIEACLLTRANPNKLFISCEEEDQRCCGRVEDFFGNIYAKFENDPMAMVGLVMGVAGRVTKAVMTNGASELSNFLGDDQ